MKNISQKQEFRQYMASVMYYQDKSECPKNATNLAEQTAIAMNCDSFLDDSDHWVWELALEFFTE